jgi:hypothetical protein
MHRSSESTAAIATALAKAQTELANPEKAMVGTIYNRSNSPQPFRYASLSAGLDIIRKTLGGHQIAIAQTTDIDRASGTVNLTTVLLHTSGEWISSHWPVCPLSETAAPRRMGAALTYARRYALFTLVGIAGEDDLDAPDLTSARPNGDLPPTSPLNIAPIGDRRDRPIQVRTESPAAPVRETLSIETSAAIRAQLIQEIETLLSEDEAKLRAIAILKAKNGLALEDAKSVEAAFSARMALLADPPEPSTAVAPAPPPAPIDAAAAKVVVKRGRGRPRKANSRPQMPVEPQPAPRDSEPPRQLAEVPKTARQDLNATSVIKIDKSMLLFSEVRRHRDKPHLRFVALQPCLVCGRSPADPHHLRFAQPRALGRKTSDEFVVPLCRTHHRQNHEVGDERAWWKAINTDPLAVALRLWRISRGIVDKNS